MGVSQVEHLKGICLKLCFSSLERNMKHRVIFFSYLYSSAFFCLCAAAVFFVLHSFLHGQETTQDSK